MKNDRSQVQQALKRNRLFAELSEEQLWYVEQRLQKIFYQKGEILFNEGDPGDALFLLVVGGIDICINDENGERVVLNHMQAGDSFGELSLLDGRPRSATAVTTTPARLLRLKRSEFHRIIEKWPTIPLTILARFSDRMRGNTDSIQELANSLSNANRQLKELDKLKSSFIGVVTHEMRTPLANAQFALDFLQKMGLDNLRDEQLEELNAVKENVGISRTMINNLVVFATFLSKQGVLETAAFDFNQLVKQVVETLTPLAQNKKIKLIDNANTELIVEGDESRLRDAVHHLLHNGIKFTPEGGVVKVKSRIWDKQLMFEVLDNGEGVPPELLPTLWDSFSQMADPLRRGAEGLGLGLTLVRYVARAHGGEEWAQIAEGQGSKFGFTIPLKQPGR